MHTRLEGRPGIRQWQRSGLQNGFYFLPYTCDSVEVFNWRWDRHHLLLKQSWAHGNTERKMETRRGCRPSLRSLMHGPLRGSHDPMEGWVCNNPWTCMDTLSSKVPECYYSQLRFPNYCLFLPTLGLENNYDGKCRVPIDCSNLYLTFH